MNQFSGGDCGSSSDNNWDINTGDDYANNENGNTCSINEDAYIDLGNNSGSAAHYETSCCDGNHNIGEDRDDEDHVHCDNDDNNEECNNFYNCDDIDSAGVDDDDNNYVGCDADIFSSENEDNHSDDDESDDDSDEEDDYYEDNDETIEYNADQNSEISLYDGAPVSCEEFRSMLLALQQKHNFSSSATNNILKLFQVALPFGNKCPSSNYKLETELNAISYSFKKTTTCKNCQHILDESLCTNRECCLYENDGIGENSSIFYVIDLVEEIKVFVSGE